MRNEFARLQQDLLLVDFNLSAYVKTRKLLLQNLEKSKERHEQQRKLYHKIKQEQFLLNIKVQKLESQVEELEEEIEPEEEQMTRSQD